MSSIGEQIEKIRAKYTWHYDNIRQEPGRTPEWRRQQLARLYREARTESNVAMETHKAAQAQRKRSFESKVYGLGGIAGDPASLAISRRDAGDRAANLKNDAEAQTLLERAERSGDEPLARAIAEQAISSGWLNTTNAFLDRRPHLDEAVNELWSVTARSLQDDIREAMTLGSLKPSELVSMTDQDVDRTADAPLEGKAALSGAQLAASRTERIREAMQTQARV
jgi:hypothetical protein